jgi:hypothetical protein
MLKKYIAVVCTINIQSEFFNFQKMKLSRTSEEEGTPHAHACFNRNSSLLIDHGPHDKHPYPSFKCKSYAEPILLAAVAIEA